MPVQSDAVPLQSDAPPLHVTLKPANDMEKENNAFFPWVSGDIKIAENKWTDVTGTTHYGPVTVIFYHPNALDADGAKIINPYGWMEFENRFAMIGENFKVAKAHVVKERYKDRHLMPNDEGFLTHRSGFSLTDIDTSWFSIESFLGGAIDASEKGIEILHQLVETKASHGDYGIIMGALEFLGLTEKGKATEDFLVPSMAEFGHKLTKEHIQQALSLKATPHPLTLTTDTAKDDDANPQAALEILGVSPPANNLINTAKVL